MDIDKKSLKSCLVDWLLDMDDHEQLPQEISALHFGLYVGGYTGEVGFLQIIKDHPYEIELTGSVNYDPYDHHWVGEEDFVPACRSCPGFSIPEDFERDVVLNETADMLREIVDELNILSVLNVPYITVGFTDGDFIVSLKQ